MKEKIIILDFGSQYTQLIARRVRDEGVFCEIYPYNKSINITDKNISGIILSGSPFSCLQEDCLDFDINNFLINKPVLAICYSAQYIAKGLGGNVYKSKTREYGKAILNISNESELFKGINNGSLVWMSHSDSILELPKNCKVIAKTDNNIIAAYEINTENSNIKSYALQFHPEVVHTEVGNSIFRNFLFNICKSKINWSSRNIIEEEVKLIKEKVGNQKVILGLSGGVDSSVAAYILNKAIGNQLYCVFIDNGLLRLNEFEEVLNSYKNSGLNVIGVNSKEIFYEKLKGVIDPEEKRKIIGQTFISEFEKVAKTIDDIKFLAQGTIYPDVIESVSVKGPSATIKSHHNVGGLPEKLGFELIEPLRMLFKDEVRKIGIELNIDRDIIFRHPFPGPGLAIRIIGEINKNRIDILQQADYYFTKNLKDSGWYEKSWQSGVILTGVKSVGVMGDERTYEEVVALRCVNSIDGMTADFVHLPHDLLGKISNDIVNNIKGINRVVYDISSKPPSTIEWE